ncbi:DUOX2 [Symbiodinium pilosum]|uniref:DUOX2 protein n=1 Tax=Symbiodinium pilosum TaxID=2952 RepID=A0A812KWM1_SYMPI|nr:DUOX2 [Symbiodinium pilosum]
MCDEFQGILKAVIAPKRDESNAAYGRSEINVPQAVDFCMRKAAQNASGELSFDEFSSFLRVLRKAGASSRKADLVFALFDLDQSGFLDKDEFLEVYRYFLGHRPTAEKFEEEWASLDMKVEGYVSQKRYNQWLRASSNPVFKQYASSHDDDVYGRVPKLSKKDADGLLRLTQHKRSQWRPLWNDRWNCQDNSLLNKVLMPRHKHMFSRVQSETELRRFYARHPRWDAHYQKLDTPEPVRPQTMLTADIAPLIPERHAPSGRMRNPQTGRHEHWNDYWQTPKSASLIQKYTPGSIHLRCPGRPPDHLIQGREDDEDELT